MSTSTEKEKVRKERYEEKRQGTRARTWWFVLYPDDLPEDWIDRLKSIKAKFVLSPFHDKDENADGTPKKPHYHVVFMFDGLKSEQQMQGLFVNLFGQAANTKSIPGVATISAKTGVIHDRSGAIRYLAHIDNPEKYQYDVNEIQGFNGADIMELLTHSMSETQDTIKAMCRFITDNNITEMCDAVFAMGNNPEWFLILTTKSTMFFNAFIRSYRHKRQLVGDTQKAICDEETGEVIEKSVLLENP